MEIEKISQPRQTIRQFGRCLHIPIKYTNKDAEIKNNHQRALRRQQNNQHGLYK